MPGIEASAGSLGHGLSIGVGMAVAHRRWVGTGSQGEYGPKNRRIFEKDPPQPTTVYGAAKLSTCLLTHPDQVMHLEVDIDKLRKDTGWSPQVTLEEGIARLVESIKADFKQTG